MNQKNCTQKSRIDYKEDDALVIIEEMDQLKELIRIFTKDDSLGLNVKLINESHDAKTILETHIKALIKKWEWNYGERFETKNYLSAYARIKG